MNSRNNINYINRLVAQAIIDKLKAKTFLVQQALEKPSLHWWITDTRQDADDAFQHLSQDLQGVTPVTDRIGKQITLYNNSSIHCFPLSDFELHRGESPMTIVFYHVHIPRDTWNYSITALKSSATLNTFMIASEIG